MAKFSLNITTLTTAMNTYNTDLAALVAAQSAYDAVLITPPPIGVTKVASNNEWNNYIDVLDAWNVTLAGLLVTLNAAKATLAVDVLGVIALLGVNTATAVDSWVVDIWVTVPSSTPTWVGVAANTSQLVVSTVNPGSHLFPNV